MRSTTARRRWLPPLALAWSALVAVLLLLPYADLAFSSVVPVVQALWPLWALAAIVTLLVWLGLRQWVAAAVVAAALVVGLLPAALAGSSADPVRDGGRLTVLAANVEFSQGDPQDVADLVREREVGVLVLLEIDQGYLDRLRAIGLDADLPHGWDRPVSGGATGTTILTRMPQADETRWPAGFDHRFQMPAVRVEVGGREVVVRAVHTLPPAPPPAPDWRAELEGLDSWVDDVPEGTDLVLAGTSTPAVRTPPSARSPTGSRSRRASARAPGRRTVAWAPSPTSTTCSRADSRRWSPARRRSRAATIAPSGPSSASPTPRSEASVAGGTLPPVVTGE